MYCCLCMLRVVCTQRESFIFVCARFKILVFAFLFKFDFSSSHIIFHTHICALVVAYQQQSKLTWLQNALVLLSRIALPVASALEGPVELFEKQQSRSSFLLSIRFFSFWISLKKTKPAFIIENVRFHFARCSSPSI